MELRRVVQDENSLLQMIIATFGGGLLTVFGIWISRKVKPSSEIRVDEKKAETELSVVLMTRIDQQDRKLDQQSKRVDDLEGRLMIAQTEALDAKRMHVECEARVTRLQTEIELRLKNLEGEDLG